MGKIGRQNTGKTKGGREAIGKKVWSPLKGSQTIAMGCPCHIIFYEGTRGPGKTDWQLMFFRKNVGIGYGAFWRGVIFDRQYKNLDDLIAKSRRWFPQFDDGARFLSSKSDYRWVWPTGETLAFRQVKRQSDYWDHHGQEYPYIGWNELPKYPTSELFDAMMSCNRSSFLPEEHSPEDGLILPPIPLVVTATGNPFGAGHTWVKRRFVDPAPPGVVVRNTTNVFNPQTQQREDVVKMQVRIFGSYKENRYLSPEYVAELENIRDPNKRKAWIEGDWNIVVGGALDDVWGDFLVVPRFKIPATWRIDRSMDWGSSHPFSIGWWAEANGEEATLPNGNKFCPAPGSLIRIAEWYGSREIGANEGLKMSVKDISDGIKDREAQMRLFGWVSGRINAGPADNQIGALIEKDTLTIRKKFESQKIYWTDSDKRPGSRINGLQLIRERMEASRRGEGPGIYFMDNCRAAISILPTLPRDEDNPDDVDTDAEDHVYDDVRYRVLASNKRVSKSLKVSFPT